MCNVTRKEEEPVKPYACVQCGALSSAVAPRSPHFESVFSHLSLSPPPPFASLATSRLPSHRSSASGKCEAAAAGPGTRGHHRTTPGRNMASQQPPSSHSSPTPRPVPTGRRCRPRLHACPSASRHMMCVGLILVVPSLADESRSLQFSPHVMLELRPASLGYWREREVQELGSQESRGS